MTAGNKAPDLGRAVLPRARRIASQPQRSQIKRREPTERLCAFAAVHPGPHLRFFLEGTKIAPSHRNASVMHRTPRDRSVPCRARPLSRVALRRCDHVRSHTLSARVRVRYEFDTIFGPTESRRTAACSPQDAQM